MLFRITSDRSIRYFDNVLLKIYDKDNQEINFLDYPIYQGLRSSKSYSNFIEPKSNRIDHLKIQLGLKCNYSCKYCLQQEQRANLPKEVSLPIEVLIKNFIKKLAANIESVNQITLWGGEPLVYIKHLKLLVPKRKELYPNVRLKMITNGSLINESIIDFLIKYEISVDVSHDGKSFSKYRNDKDPLKDPDILKALKRFKHFCDLSNKVKFRIRSVIVPETIDLQHTIEYFESIFNEPVNVFFESVLRNDEESIKEDIVFSSLDSNNLIQNIVQVCDTPTNNTPFYSLRMDVSDIMIKIVNQVDMNTVPYRCGNGKKNRLNLDLKGNVLACPSEDAKDSWIGNLDNLIEVKNNKFIPWWDRKICKNCPFLVACQGGCSTASNEKQEIICKSYRFYYSALFISAWKHLFNETILKIEPL